MTTSATAVRSATDMVVVDDLSVSVSTPQGRFNVVDSVRLTIAAGETLGLVGESGSGKSMTGAAMCRLLPQAARQDSGEVRVEGIDLSGLSEREMASRRGTIVSIIFQDPMTSLDPAFTIGHQIKDVLLAHGRSSNEAHDRALETLSLVRISDPERRFRQYPHQLSGGMRQRVLIAMAISCGPRLLIADEPTTALDTTTQAQILSLLRTLSQDLQMATLLTTHDLGVACEMCSRVAVMYAGQIVESGTLERIFERPRHPYTERLLDAIPSQTRSPMAGGIPGQVPSLQNLPRGCRFHPRCQYCVEEICTVSPILLTREDDREVRCARGAELHLKGVFE